MPFIFTALMVANQRVFVISNLEVVTVIDPLLLNKLELTFDTGSQRHEDNTVIAIVSRILIRLAIGQAPAQQPPAIGQRAGSIKSIFNAKFQGTTRIRATHVSAKRAPTTCKIVMVVKSDKFTEQFDIAKFSNFALNLVTGLRQLFLGRCYFLFEFIGFLFRCEACYRGAVFPPAGEFGGSLIRAIREFFTQFRYILIKRIDVFV